MLKKLWIRSICCFLSRTGPESAATWSRPPCKILMRTSIPSGLTTRSTTRILSLGVTLRPIHSAFYRLYFLRFRIMPIIGIPGQERCVQLYEGVSPNTLNEFKLGFNRFIQFLTDFEKDRDIPAELGISRLDSQFGGHPTISIAGFSRTGGISNSPNDRFDNTYVLINNLTHTRGDHRLSTGVSFRHYQNNRAGFQPQPRGQFVFNETYTTFPGAPATGHSMADFLLGFPFQSTRV